MANFSRVRDYAPGDHAVLAGHLGTLPVERAAQVITLLREPAARAWSHYRTIPWKGEPLPFADFLEHPIYGWLARDYHAHWLTVPPDEAGWGPAPGVALPAGVEAVAQHGVAGAARTLDRCALVGTTERAGEFAAALARLLGRRLPQLGRLNVGVGASSPPPREAELVRARSRVDLALYERAGRRLDTALRDLPTLPEDPPGELPYVYGMEEPLCGTGWHARVHTADAGWHRWTGPGLRSTLRLPVRLGGPARLALAIVSACDDNAVRSLRLTLQGRPLTHALEPRRTGVAAVADAQLDPSAPLELEVEVSHTRTLTVDPAGLAIGTLELTPA
jgi:hypothetical protein